MNMTRLQGRLFLMLALSLLALALAAGGSRADIAAGTELVSRASGAEGAEGDLPSFEPTATANGRLVYFTSYATNFTPLLPAPGLRLFRRDTRDDQTTLVPTRGHQPEDPVVSANGRALAYLATVDYGEGGGHKEIFVRDTRTGNTSLASRADGTHGAPAAAPPAHELYPSVGRPSLSANGRYLAFVSSAPNLYPRPWSERVPPQIYVRDLRAGTTTLVSRASGRRGRIAGAPCAEPEISADGRHIVFTSSATDLAPIGPQGDVFSGNVFERDLATSKTIAVSRTAVATTSYSPAVSADGRYVAFFRKGPTVAPQVFERDLRSHRTVLVSRASGEQGAPATSFATGRSFLAISPDGHLIAFFSNAANLGGPPPPGGSAGNFGLYLRDLRTAETSLVHWEGWGRPRFAADGRYLFFGTFDTDKPTPNGAYATGQIYRYDRGVGR